MKLAEKKTVFVIFGFESILNYNTKSMVQGQRLPPRLRTGFAREAWIQSLASHGFLSTARCGPTKDTLKQNTIYERRKYDKFGPK